jgi:predicted amidophosphoribosyltransferase
MIDINIKHTCDNCGDEIDGCLCDDCVDKIKEESFDDGKKEGYEEGYDAGFSADKTESEK